MSDLIKQTGNKDIAKNPDPIYLLNTRNGRILMWTPILAVRKEFVDCDINGNPMNPQDVAADNPYIIQETKRVADDMAAVGGSPDMVNEYGRMLIERGIEKFKSLESDGIHIKRLSNDKQYSIVKGDSFYRVYERIDQMASDAIGEIQLMTLQYLRKLAGHEYRDYSRNEVSYQWQIDSVMNEIRGL